MTMVQSAAIAFAGLSGLVILFHLAIVLGAPLGHLTMGGRWAGTLPPAARILSVISGVLIGGMACVLLIRAGLLPGAVADWAVWGTVGLSALSVLANLATPSRAERRLWGPVTVLMLAAAVVVASGGAASV